MIAEAMIDQNVPPEIIDAEIEQMREVRIGPPADRSVVGSMNDFIFLADHRRDGVPGLAQSSLELARVPCGPLFKRHVRPDAELAALIAAQR